MAGSQSTPAYAKMSYTNVNGPVSNTAVSGWFSSTNEQTFEWIGGGAIPNIDISHEWVADNGALTVSRNGSQASASAKVQFRNHGQSSTLTYSSAVWPPANSTAAVFPTNKNHVETFTGGAADAVTKLITVQCNPAVKAEATAHIATQYAFNQSASAESGTQAGNPPIGILHKVYSADISALN